MTARDYGGDLGQVVWMQCQTCGELYKLRIPGAYPGREVREGTRRKRDAIFDAFAENSPEMTVRQVYYQLAVLGAVPKTAAGYRQAQYQLTDLRRREILPYGWIADNTRWQIKPETYDGLESAMRIWHDAYRRDLWARQAVHVEIWVEKDALAGVISPITGRYGVALYVARGFSSITFAYDAAESIKHIGKPTYIYHFGDFDPSGVNAASVLREELDRHGADVWFERAAITLDQVRDYDLPTLRVNRKDPRAKTWDVGFVCELDALPAKVLREMVERCIVQHIDGEEWHNTQEAERLERQALGQMQRYFIQEQSFAEALAGDGTGRGNE